MHIFLYCKVIEKNKQVYFNMLVYVCCRKYIFFLNKTLRVYCYILVCTRHTLHCKNMLTRIDHWKMCDFSGKTFTMGNERK